MMSDARVPSFLSDEFGEFMNACFEGQKVSVTQVTEMKAAFFSGALVVFSKLMRIYESNLTRAEAAAFLHGLHLELEAYGERMKQV